MKKDILYSILVTMTETASPGIYSKPGEAEKLGGIWAHWITQTARSSWKASGNLDRGEQPHILWCFMVFYGKPGEAGQLGQTGTFILMINQGTQDTLRTAWDKQVLQCKLDIKGKRNHLHSRGNVGSQEDKQYLDTKDNQEVMVNQVQQVGEPGHYAQPGKPQASWTTGITRCSRTIWDNLDSQIYLVSQDHWALMDRQDLQCNLDTMDRQEHPHSRGTLESQETQEQLKIKSHGKSMVSPVQQTQSDTVDNQEHFVFSSLMDSMIRVTQKVG